MSLSQCAGPQWLSRAVSFGMLVELRDGVERAVKAGWTEEAAVRDVKLPAYAAIPRYDDWLPHDVRSAYRYLKGA